MYRVTILVTCLLLNVQVFTLVLEASKPSVVRLHAQTNEEV